MEHIAQERYSTLVDEKLRYTLVTKDNLIFNTRYEGNPKAGKVKVPVRDTEVEVSSMTSRMVLRSLPALPPTLTSTSTLTRRSTR